MANSAHRPARHRHFETGSRLVMLLFGVLSVLGTTDGAAHHSWSRYDNDAIIEVTGTVTRVEWANPHVVMFFTETTHDGDAVEWTAEMDPPTLLLRYGMRHDTIASGMSITLTGVRARSGAPVMRAVTIELEDGTVHRVSSRV